MPDGNIGKITDMGGEEFRYFGKASGIGGVTRHLRTLAEHSVHCIQALDELRSIKDLTTPMIVPDDVGRYGILDASDFLNAAGLPHAPCTVPKPIGMRWEEAIYSTNEYACRFDISWHDIEKLGERRPRFNAIRLLTRHMLLLRTNNMCQELFSAGLWTNEYTGAPVTDVNDKFGGVATLTSPNFPHLDHPGFNCAPAVKHILTNVKLNSNGLKPNRMAVQEGNLELLLCNTALINQYTSQSFANNDDIRALTKAQLELVLGVKIVPISAIMNDGPGTSARHVMRNGVLFYHEPEMGRDSMEVAASFTNFEWSGLSKVYARDAISPQMTVDGVTTPLFREVHNGFGGCLSIMAYTNYGFEQVCDLSAFYIKNAFLNPVQPSINEL